MGAIAKALRIFAVCVLAGAAASCASLYIHDDGLAEEAATARTTIDGADLIAPYDQRITALNTLVEREDRAVLEFEVAQRDAQLAILAVASDGRGQDSRRAIVTQLLTTDWQVLIGAAPLAANLLTQRESLNSVSLAELDARTARYDANGVLAEARRTYADDARAAGVTVRFLECADVLALSDEAVRQDSASRPLTAVRDACRASVARALAEARRAYTEAVRAAGVTVRPLGCDEIMALSDQIIGEDPGGRQLSEIREACRGLAAQDEVDLYAGITADLRGGALGRAIAEELRAEVAVSAARAKHALDRLDRELAAANEAGESTAAARAAALEASLREDVAQGGSIAEFFRWSRIEAEFDRIERALTCRAGEDAVTEEERKAANCDAIAGATTENKTRVLLAFAAAIAGVEDANDEAIRSGHWLRAARAIVSARKEAAKLRLSRDRAVLNAARQRTRALLAQADALAYGLQTIMGEDSECSGAPTACAIQAYVESRDRGAALASVLDQRETQADRLLNAQLARLAAQTDAELLRAAVGQLDEYGKGGIEPGLIARVIFDLGLIGAVGND